MLNINARSILSKIDEIVTLLHIIKVQCNFTFDLICIEESWLNENTEQLAAIPGYNLITEPKKPNKIGGGLCIYIKESIRYIVRNELFQLKDNSKYDGLIVELYNISNDKNVILGVLYHSPSFATQTEFINKMDTVIRKIDTENKDCIIDCDINLDLLKNDENRDIALFLDTFISNGFLPKITLPTRKSGNSSTLIDHIFTKINKGNTLAGTYIN